MSGLRLVVGAIVMGVVVPLMLFFLLPLETAGQFFTVSAVSFLSWGVADLGASVLSRRRLVHRSPGSAIRDWDVDRRDNSQE